MEGSISFDPSDPLAPNPSNPLIQGAFLNDGEDIRREGE